MPRIPHGTSSLFKLDPGFLIQTEISRGPTSIGAVPVSEEQIKQQLANRKEPVVYVFENNVSVSIDCPRQWSWVL